MNYGLAVHPKLKPGGQLSGKEGTVIFKGLVRRNGLYPFISEWEETNSQLLHDIRNTLDLRAFEGQHRLIALEFPVSVSSSQILNFVASASIAYVEWS